MKFSLFAASIALLLIGASCGINTVHTNTTTTNTVVTNTNSTSSGDVHVTLVNDGTSAVLANKAVSVYSDNGTRCVAAPCPTNGRTWTGTTDANGVFTLPVLYVDQSMSVTVDGYNGGVISYDQAISGSAITVRLKSK